MGCNICPFGFQCPYKDKGFIENCPPGTYSLGEQNNCIECPEHHDCSHKDTISIIADGFFSPKGTGISLKCPAGWECGWDESITSSSSAYTNAVGEGYARKCEQGYYSQAGQSLCTQCADITVEIYAKTIDDGDPDTDEQYYQSVDIGNVYCPYKDAEPQICP